MTLLQPEIHRVSKAMMDIKRKKQDISGRRAEQVVRKHECPRHASNKGRACLPLPLFPCLKFQEKETKIKRDITKLSKRLEVHKAWSAHQATLSRAQRPAVACLVLHASPLALPLYPTPRWSRTRPASASRPSASGSP